MVRNGILWAVGDKAKADLMQMHLANPKYFDGPVPNYEKEILLHRYRGFNA
jgi:hypothetical protein